MVEHRQRERLQHQQLHQQRGGDERGVAEDVGRDGQAEVAGVDVDRREGPDHRVRGRLAPHEPGGEQVERGAHQDAPTAVATRLRESTLVTSARPRTVTISAGLATKKDSRDSTRCAVEVEDAELGEQHTEGDDDADRGEPLDNPCTRSVPPSWTWILAGARGQAVAALRRAREARRLATLPQVRTSCQTRLLLRERS